MAAAIFGMDGRLQQSGFVHQFDLPANTGLGLSQGFGDILLLNMWPPFQHHQYLELRKAQAKAFLQNLVVLAGQGKGQVLQQVSAVGCSCHAITIPQ